MRFAGFQGTSADSEPAQAQAAKAPKAGLDPLP